MLRSVLHTRYKLLNIVKCKQYSRHNSYRAVNNEISTSRILRELSDEKFALYGLGSEGCSIEQNNDSAHTFSGGYIDLQKLVEKENIVTTFDNPEFYDGDIGFNNSSVLQIRFEELFSDSIDHVFRCNDNLEDPFGKCFTVLQNYFSGNDKAFHEQCLRSAQEQDDEMKIAVTLTTHLLSQLISDKNGYIISSDYKQKEGKCPCGICKSDVNYGQTYIGSKYLWHGRPDVFLFPRYPGMVNIVYPERCSDDKKFVEINSDQAALKDLEANHFQQVALQTITVSFYERFKHVINTNTEKAVFNKNHTQSLIPTIALSHSGFDVYMYDSVHDIFLKNTEHISIFDEKYNIIPSSVVLLWFIIHYSAMNLHIPQKVLPMYKNTCGLLTCIDDDRLNKLQQSLTMKRTFESLPVEEAIVLKNVPYKSVFDRVKSNTKPERIFTMRRRDRYQHLINNKHDGCKHTVDA